jgi:hypothetical protein
MFKLVSHCVIFSLGAGLGVWWGVNHPTQAAIIAGREDTYITRAKTEAQKILGNDSTNNNASAQPVSPPSSASPAPGR